MAPSIVQETGVKDDGTAQQQIPFKSVPNPASDSAVYDIHHQKFTTEGQPSTTDAWIERAKQVSEILAQDAAERDIENKSPRAEAQLLKSSGLLKVLGPKEIGGGGQTWDVGYKVIREVAKGDGSIGMLLGYHILWSTTANVVGSDEQKHRFQKLIIENNYFVGGAVNPRDSDLKITDKGDHFLKASSRVRKITSLQSYPPNNQAFNSRYLLPISLAPPFRTKTLHSIIGTTSASGSPNPAASKSTQFPSPGSTLSAGTLTPKRPSPPSSRSPSRLSSSPPSN
ncbi:hypothetical protein G7Y89_g6723 [Cudoniella acicularis]|uniref:Acyl-CoA dehydrogenase/oxidase N-terminal domain-containing protein n=1 Tax=Cudoniella acicularis TaxID=354080 RepID=A0A8H4RJW7_9HELO|nr:hypothetical protein G7Y89_g6723 [Cudoniella acicularis]